MTRLLVAAQITRHPTRINFSASSPHSVTLGDEASQGRRSQATPAHSQPEGLQVRDRARVNDRYRGVLAQRHCGLSRAAMRAQICFRL
jgi:hypothetical protein